MVLPHAIVYNTPAAPDAVARIARALGTGNAARGLYDLAKSLGAPTALKDIGMPDEQLDRYAAIATQNAYWNPRPIEQAEIRGLLEATYYGNPPV